MTEEAVAISADEFALPESPLHKIVAAATSTRVLLVEDDPEAAGLVQLTLSGDRIDPFDVEWVSSLTDAMIRLSQPGIDVVLLDLGLPELSGYKSLRVIESACEHRLPVVIFTADDRSISRDLTLALGASDYLLKHEASPAQLKKSLRDAVLRRRTQ